jgi:hypothetical protein
MVGMVELPDARACMVVVALGPEASVRLLGADERIGAVAHRGPSFGCWGHTRTCRGAGQYKRKVAVARENNVLRTKL